MKIALISDSHTKENIAYILEYLKKKAWKLDLIIINGDILGENEVREGYGYNYNKTIFLASLNKDKILQSLAQDLYQNLKKIPEYITHGISDEKIELELSGIITEYVRIRYNYLYNILLQFSQIAKTYFNVGVYESPLHYNILKELAFLLDINESYVRKIALSSNYRETFKEFTTKLKDPSIKKLNYLGDSPFIEGDLLIAGIPGLNSSSIPGDSLSDFQEKTTDDRLATIKRHMSYVTKLLLINQTQGKLRKYPFAYRPASYSVRNFIESTKGKLRQKIFVQSYHHWLTTHFYYASEYHFILNNSAVNNCLFNVIEISSKVSCYDVDPRKDIVRKINPYNYDLADYSSPVERLKLNYEDAEQVINERKIAGCYYM